MIEFQLNGQRVSVDVEADTPLLWVIRDELQQTGTKFGCGMAQCGACTVLMNGNPVRSCVMPVSAISGQEITTIEGLEGKHPLQAAWVELDVPQCGYCQSGQILSAAALLAQNPNPSDDEIKEYMSGNICRCGAYPEILAAIKHTIKNAGQISRIETNDSNIGQNLNKFEQTNSKVGYWSPGLVSGQEAKS